MWRRVELASRGGPEAPRGDGLAGVVEAGVLGNEPVSLLIGEMNIELRLVDLVMARKSRKSAMTMLVRAVDLNFLCSAAACCWGGGGVVVASDDWDEMSLLKSK